MLAGNGQAARLMINDQQLRTGAWYGDSPIHLSFPPGWIVTTHWPNTPPPLSDSEILRSLEQPVGQPRLRDLCKGKSRPLVLVDDVNRPTPAARILPFLLKEFEAAGIASSQITILVARGSHGEPCSQSLRLKVGQQAASMCRVLLHDPYRNTTKIGKTSFGTPVYVNKEIRNADFVVGIGGVYPNNTAGFGGGAKLALGILDVRVISQLHHKHKSAGWGIQDPESSFRKDLDEIAQIIGMQSLVTAHVNADRELVRLRSGDFGQYYEQEVAFVQEAFRAPKPNGADVVVSNAFPNDLSLTFIHMKGIYPLRHAAPGASRIVLGSCSEGEGFHGVFPIVRMPLFHVQRDRLRRIPMMPPSEIVGKIIGKFTRKFHHHASPGRDPQITPAGRSPETPLPPKNPIWFYRTEGRPDTLPSQVRSMKVRYDWNEILEIVSREQAGRERLKVVVYPCAPLQVLE
jgi:lactate racemase